MNAIKISCPKCGGQILRSAELVGREAPCPHCGESIFVGVAPPPRLPNPGEQVENEIKTENGETRVDKYFMLMGEIETARKVRDFERMLVACKESIDLLPSVIQSTKREFGRFDFGSIPAITQGCIFWSIFGNVSDIVAAQKFCSHLKDLEDWDYEFEEAKRRAALVNRVKTFIAANPGFSQDKLKKSLGEADGRFLSSAVHYMEIAGLLRREKLGKTYRVFAERNV